MCVRVCVCVCAQFCEEDGGLNNRSKPRVEKE